MTITPRPAPALGIVAIGRNEGERLGRCLRSTPQDASTTLVYVDSGSTDGSTRLANQLGADVVPLDMSVPFSAARARNAGWQRLVELAPHAQLVQFIDADCELDAAWLTTGTALLARDSRCAVACGRRRERHPEASIYNRLCDLEWDTAPGEVRSCGGDALMRIEALQAVGGFDPTLIAGEEPELCFRLREAGWTIQRVAAEMTRHDAAMTRFHQWWRRTMRAGHAAVEGAWLHGRSAERFNVRRVVSILAWGLLPILATLAALPIWGGPAALILLVYPVLWLKVLWKERRRGWRWSALLATFTVLAKLPQALGVATFFWNRLRGRRTRVMDYKGAARVEAAEGPPAAP